MKTHAIWKIAGLFALALITSPCFAAGTAKATFDPFKTIAARDPSALTVPVVTGPEIWKDPTQPIDARVNDLISRMSLAEKVSQLRADAAGIPRLGIPAYSYRNECLHGVVGNTGVSTEFPEPIGMAATWDVPLIHDEADVISTEGRAKFNDYTSKHNGNSAIHAGISFYAPNINIVRDPRWGRGQETYGEDPYLTARFGVAFIRGLQGDDPRYIKAMACAKHFAVHSGPERARAFFNATPPERDLYETYLPAFEAAVREGQVGSVMGSYNALYGTPNCANPFLLTDVLRNRWGFQGYVVSDGGAIQYIWRFHGYTATLEEAAAVAVKAGCDLFSNYIGLVRPNVSKDEVDDEVLGRMVSKNLLSEDEIDSALRYTLAARFRLGLFDPPSMVPWSSIGIDQNDTPEHRALALKVAEESLVLLKNNGLLPLDKTKLTSIAVIGPNADSAHMQLGNYCGPASHIVTILDGIKQLAGPRIDVTYLAGCPITLKADNSNLPTPATTEQAVAMARAADITIFVGGIDASQEGEGYDRRRIELPNVQLNLLKALQATGKPIIFVDCGGSAIAMPWAAETLPAILQAWYPGEQGGLAVAEALFGDINPSGRLPVTFYRSTDDLPPFVDYSMTNRTYRYFAGKPLYAFGHGLSYTQFAYSSPKLDAAAYGADGTINLSFTVTNTGSRDGDEVAQVYFRHVKSAVPQPKLALCGFTRVDVAKGQAANVAVSIPVQQFRYWDVTQHQYVVEPGDYELLIGSASDDIRLHIPLKIVSQ